MFFKEFDIRWSDLDANRHLANSAYINFMSHTRMTYLGILGFNQKSMAKHNIGPVVFYEHMYYFKEVFPGKPIKVSLGLQGLSKDGMFFEFEHNFYDSDGKNFARCEMMGAWMDLKERKLIGLPQEFLDAFGKMEKEASFKVLTKVDTRKFAKIPKDL
ncbi:acyl-CoA thioesterase [Flagellimonas meridianipacifica]|uniref:Acyl-CoA thioester hydrolase n=1 Tax=Flagellimonas meridianipacifica TaxID=1080225 RepID=A0A2T0MGK5_9FLAO|nr:thioesterase family protein [Allomuricauda pacifica]PRX56708.1 acyl-CoA thioester hydrolase [Allomuricauda pacifica]